MQITAHYEPDLDLMKRAMRRASAGQRRKLGVNAAVLLAVGLAVSFVAGTDDGAFTEYITPAAVTVFLLMAFVHIYLWVSVVLTTAKITRNRFRTAEPVTYVLTEDRLSTVSPSEESSVSWRLIGTITEYHDMWLIRREDDPNHVWSLAKVAMVPGDVDVFREFAATRRQIGAAPARR